MIEQINPELKKYIDEVILPQYNDNIGGHGLDHIEYVIARSFELAEKFFLDVDPNMVYTIAAFHDIGYKENPDEHEEVSAAKFIEDKTLPKFFDKGQILTIAQAIIDHRASLEYEARSVYGKLVSSADREISVENMLTRSINYQADKHAAENPTPEQVIDYSYAKLSKKFGVDGYAKMYFIDEKYTEYLALMQSLLSDKSKFVAYEKELMSDELVRRLTEGE